MTAAAGHVHQDVADYYTGKIRQFGATPLGVDWTCMPTQELRFVQLLKICDWDLPFSLNDLGCGYGAMLAYLAKRHRRVRVDYLGQDVSEAMVNHATKLWAGTPKASFATGHELGRTADYSVASGIFNVRLAHSRARWEAHVRATLAELHTKSRRAYAVNFLAPVTATGPRELYRATPEKWARFCEEELGGEVTVLADYGLREFTLLVRKAA